MAYIGNPPADRYSSVSYQDLTGGTGTSFTLDYAVGSANEIEVFVNNVRQEPSVAYTVSGTALTMTGSIASTDDFYVVFQSKAQQTVTHPATHALEATDGTFTGNVSITGTTSSTGAITATAGIIVPSGQGIDFSATSDGSGTTSSELFDDYEEGTFTITVSTGVTSPTYTNQQGSYVKIGRCVTFRAYLNLSTGTANASAFILAGLPFTSANEARYGGAFFNFNGGFYTSNEITAHIPQNSTTIQFYATNGNALSGNSINSGGDILAQAILQGFYYV